MQASVEYCILSDGLAACKRGNFLLTCVGKEGKQCLQSVAANTIIPIYLCTQVDYVEPNAGLG